MSIAFVVLKLEVTGSRNSPGGIGLRKIVIVKEIRPTENYTHGFVFVVYIINESPHLSDTD